MTEKIELEIIKGEELKFLSPYFQDYIIGNRMPFLKNLDRIYSFPIAYDSNLINKLFHLMIDDNEAREKLNQVYEKIKNRSKYSDYYRKFTLSPFDEFIDTDLGRELTTAIQEHLITAFSEDQNVNYFNSRLSLYLASSYFNYIDKVKTTKPIAPKNNKDLEHVFNHLKAIYYLEENQIFRTKLLHKNINSYEYGDLYDDDINDSYSYNINIGGDIIDVKSDESAKNTEILVSYYQKRDADLSNTQPDIFISIPKEYYKSLFFNNGIEVNFEDWKKIIDMSKIRYQFTTSYYSQLILSRALDTKNDELDSINRKFEELSSVINFRKEDVLTNTTGRYNRYLVSKILNIFNKHLKDYSAYSLYYITATILVEIGIAQSENEFNGKRRYSEYLTDFVKNAIRVPKV